MVAPWVLAAAAAGLAAAIAAEVLLGRRALRSGASGAGRSGASGAGRSGASGAGTTRRAIGWVAVYVSLALLFGLAVGITAGWVTAGQFYTGYLTEYSLSLDNLFVFYVIISWFAVPPDRQPRILLPLFLRTILIVAGATALNHFGWLFYPFGAVLVWTAIGLIAGASPDGQADRHIRLTGWLRRRLLRPGQAAPASPPGPSGWPTCCSPSIRSRPCSASPPPRPWSWPATRSRSWGCVSSMRWWPRCWAGWPT